jgi:heat shock protein HslJ
MRSLPAIGMSLAAITILAACTTSSTPSSSGPSSSGTSASAASLDGHAYVSTSVTGRDLVAGSTVTLTFGAGRLGANAGCNTMSGAYQLADGKLSVGQMASTMMACPDPLMAQDTWLAAFLDGAAVTQGGDTLTLAKDGVTMQLVDKRTTNLPLEGTTWTVDGLISNEAISSVPQGVTATLVFSGGRVAVDTGCNTGSGSATSTDADIAFGPIGLTRKMCAADAMTVENLMVKVLQGDQPYTIDGDSLKIGGHGKEGLTLKGTTAPATAPAAS